MMTSAACKSDAGQSYPSQWLLPAGNRRRRDGSGHWLVAYREAEEKKYRRIQQKFRQTSRKCENSAAHAQRGSTLDGPLLLQLHCVDKPSELCSVDISERHLTSVSSEDFKAFDHVASIDASVNSLSLGSFSTFMSLRELNLALNGIRNLSFDAAEFPYLEVLDLSYNSVSADGFVSLGRLPLLKVLHLTGNRLRRLPPILDSSYHEPTQLPSEEEDSPFRSLEVLMLDDNKLSSEVFSSLIQLKKLRYLNLKGNHISEIPHMELMCSSKPAPVSTEAQKEGHAHSESDPNMSGYLKIISLIFQEDNWEQLCKENEQPLPELRVLNLANNKIVEEEVLMAAALFPMLREIDIQCNPLTTQRRGASPLLMYFQEKLGISIKRKKTEEVTKSPLTQSTYLKWKVEEKVPKAPRRSELMDASRPSRSLSPADWRNSPTKRPAASEGSSGRCPTFLEGAEKLFITQAADVPEPDVSSEDKEVRNKTSPKQLADFKTLLNAKPNPHACKPIGFQPAIRMLKHTLNHLNVYRDSKPRLDSIQKPYLEKEKRIKELPPLKTIRNPRVRAEELLREFKESSSVKVVALGSVIHDSSSNEDERKEALSLLKDLKAKYKMVYEKTMEQMASFESDTS